MIDQSNFPQTDGAAYIYSQGQGRYAHAQAFKPEIYKDISGLAFRMIHLVRNWQDDNADPYIQVCLYEGDTLPGDGDRDELFNYSGWLAKSQKFYWSDIPWFTCEGLDWGTCLNVHGDKCDWCSVDGIDCYNNNYAYYFWAVFDHCVELDPGKQYYLVWLGNMDYVIEHECYPQEDRWNGYAINIAKWDGGWGDHWEYKLIGEYTWEKHNYYDLMFQIWSRDCRFWDYEGGCGDNHTVEECKDFCEEDGCEWWWQRLRCYCEPAPLGAPAEEAMPPQEWCNYWDNQGDCEAHGCYWYDGSCHNDPPIDPSKFQRSPDVWLV